MAISTSDLATARAIARREAQLTGTVQFVVRGAGDMLDVVGPEQLRPATVIVATIHPGRS